MKDFINKLNKLIISNNKKENMNNYKSKKIQISHLNLKLITIIKLIRVKVHNLIKNNFTFSQINKSKFN